MSRMNIHPRNKHAIKEATIHKLIKGFPVAQKKIFEDGLHRMEDEYERDPTRKLSDSAQDNLWSMANWSDAEDNLQLVGSFHTYVSDMMSLLQAHCHQQAHFYKATSLDGRAVRDCLLLRVVHLHESVCRLRFPPGEGWFKIRQLCFKLKEWRNDIAHMKISDRRNLTDFQWDFFQVGLGKILGWLEGMCPEIVECMVKAARLDMLEWQEKHEQDAEEDIW